MELDAVRLSAHRGRPLGDDAWVESIASRLNLESTIRPRGRKKFDLNRNRQSKTPDPFDLSDLPFDLPLPHQPFQVVADIRHREIWRAGRRQPSSYHTSSLNKPL